MEQQLDLFEPLRPRIDPVRLAWLAEALEDARLTQTIVHAPVLVPQDHQPLVLGGSRGQLAK